MSLTNERPDSQIHHLLLSALFKLHASRVPEQKVGIFTHFLPVELLYRQESCGSVHAQFLTYITSLSFLVMD
jgi:hypothetical protein